MTSVTIKKSVVLVLLSWLVGAAAFVTVQPPLFGGWIIDGGASSVVEHQQRQQRRTPRSRATITTPPTTTRLKVSSGFSFAHGPQILVSVQKPLGLILEEKDDDEKSTTVFVAQQVADSNASAARAGVLVGDVLVAVQNANVENQSLEYVMHDLAGPSSPSGQSKVPTRLHRDNEVGSTIASL